MFWWYESKIVKVKHEMAHICMWCINEKHMYVMHTWDAWDVYIYVWNKWKKYGYAMYAWNDTIMIYIYIWNVMTWLMYIKRNDMIKYMIRWMYNENMWYEYEIVYVCIKRVYEW